MWLRYEFYAAKDLLSFLWPLVGADVLLGEFGGLVDSLLPCIGGFGLEDPLKNSALSGLGEGLEVGFCLGVILEGLV